MYQLTSKQRAYLSSLANSEKAIIQIGRDGVTPEVTDAVSEALRARELVKVNVQKNCLYDVKETAQMCAERTRSAVVQTIGRKFVLFKENLELPNGIDLP